MKLLVSRPLRFAAFALLLIFAHGCGGGGNSGETVLPNIQLVSRERIVFSSLDGDDFAGVNTIAPDGSDRRLLLKGNSSHPSFSPDGTKIVFSSNRDAETLQDAVPSRVFVMDTDGSDQRSLPNRAESEGRVFFDSIGRNAWANITVREPTAVP